MDNKNELKELYMLKMTDTQIREIIVGVEKFLNKQEIFNNVQIYFTGEYLEDGRALFCDRTNMLFVIVTTEGLEYENPSLALDIRVNTLGGSLVNVTSSKYLCGRKENE